MIRQDLRENSGVSISRASSFRRSGADETMAGAEMDYTVHEAWNEATNVYLIAILVSFGLLVYARKNKRKIMRIFTVPPTVDPTPEPNFYDSLQKVRLRQQLEMYYIARKYDLQQEQPDSVQLTVD
ncbi:small integral membrane protein 19 isoform X2 [Chiloscyllium plagiosum]|uniref:small integral membrane protein 19 isoform X2 n=1 Tax=Chiloscyllium plagiosum TaxID=36176 RepID=UPI001CB7F0DC|nr:small integral membrane protein 19 isoform X2 [Chiloscyllium plagiosum]